LLIHNLDKLEVFLPFRPQRYYFFQNNKKNNAKISVNFSVALVTCADENYPSLLFYYFSHNHTAVGLDAEKIDAGG